MTVLIGWMVIEWVIDYITRASEVIRSKNNNGRSVQSAIIESFLTHSCFANAI